MAEMNYLTSPETHEALVEEAQKSIAKAKEKEEVKIKINWMFILKMATLVIGWVLIAKGVGWIYWRLGF